MPTLEVLVADQPGYLDSVTKHTISGWARDPSAPGKKVFVDILVNGKKRFRVKANTPRGDFIGPHGFLCQIRGGLDPTDEVRAIIFENDQELGHSPAIVGHTESVLALYSPVSDYTAYYNAKAACTLLRLLFIELHKDEASRPFNIENVRISFTPPSDRSPPTSFALVRNPYTRSTSAFLDKVVSWCYHRKSCKAQRLFHWQYGKDKSRWPELTFIDYLIYLESQVSRCSDIHFWRQPNYGKSVTICKVEDLRDSICKFYAAHHCTLLPRVEAFFDQRPDLINPSLNTTAQSLEYIDEIAYRPIREIAKILKTKTGTGIDPASFFDAETKIFATRVFSRELAQFQYRCPW